MRPQLIASSISQEALEETWRLTKGYPYLIQEWGYQTWNLAQSSPIAKSAVESAAATAIQRLDQNFFRVRFDRLTPSEKASSSSVQGRLPILPMRSLRMR